MDNEFLKLFDAELLFKNVVEDLDFFIFDNRINYIRIPSFQTLTLSASKGLQASAFSFYGEGGGVYCNIIEYKAGANIDPEARAWTAKRSDESGSISDAIVISSLSQKIAGNLYLLKNRPIKPTKFFTDLKDSISWSLERLEKQDSN